MKVSVPNRHSRGFSLVEMLVVIAVIGTIAAIAVSSISNINGAAKDSAARRNAQTIASMSAAANAAGAYHVIPATLASGGIEPSIDVLNAGVNGEYAGLFFQVPVSDEAAAEAVQFLDIQFTGSEYVLVYKADA